MRQPRDKSARFAKKVKAAPLPCRNRKTDAKVRSNHAIVIEALLALGEFSQMLLRKIEALERKTGIYPKAKKRPH